MSFGDPYTIDDLLREIHHPTGDDRVTLTREQALDLDRERETADEDALANEFEEGKAEARDECGCKKCKASAKVAAA